MQTIFRIARTELRTLFYSPIAWFLLIVFLIQCGVVYFSAISDIAIQQEIGGYGVKYINNITIRVFLSGSGVFGTVMQNLYLYIPLLTMSLISREMSSGTIKLLYSSPIDVREIVFGKFLAMMMYNLLLLAIVSLFVISGFFHIQSPDKGMLITSLVGFYLLLCAYSAIGLFMSCLTTYQVVAAICTFVMIGILTYVGTLWQGVELVRELTYFLSIRGRTQKMLGGLLTTKDVLYFILIVYIFLGFTIYKLKAGMESKPAIIKAARYIAIFASALLIGYMSSRPGFVGYYDATVNKSRTITPKVQDILSKLKEAPLQVTTYNNLIGGYWFLGTPESYNGILERWEPYMRFKPDLNLNTVYYYDSVLDQPDMLRGYPGKNLKQIAEQTAKTYDLKMSMFKTPEEIRKTIDLRPELNRFVMKLTWKDKSTFLRVYNDNQMWPGETEVAAAINRLVNGKIPKVYFLAGDLERDISKMGDREYKAVTTLTTFRYSLMNQGFDVDTVSLDNRDIPADISILVIADPKLELSAAASEKVRQYINNGGNMIIAGEPGKQAILNPVLQQLGVQMMEGTVLQESKEYSPALIIPGVTKVAGSFTKALEKSLEDSSKVAMPGAAGLTYVTDGAFNIQPLLTSDANLTWNKIKPLSPDVVSANLQSNNGSDVMSGGLMVVSISPSTAADPAIEARKRNTAGTVSFTPADGDTKGPIPMAVSLTRKVGKREQRIVVAGDADFLSNAELQRYIGDEPTANFIFNTALFSWLNYGEFPIDATRPDPKDKSVLVTTDQVDYLKIIYIWIAPALLLALGAIVLIRRKRK